MGSADTYHITVTASNGVSPDDVQDITLTVNPSADTPPAPPPLSTSSSSGWSETQGGRASASDGGVTLSATGKGGLTVAQYGSDPVSAVTFDSTGSFFDAALSNGNTFTTVTLTDCSPGAGNALEWWTGSAWRPVSPLTGPSGTPICLTAELGGASSPTSAQLVGTVFAVAEVTAAGAPSITSANAATFTAGTHSTFTVTATGDPAPTFTETGSLPSGVTLTKTSGKLSGTPAGTTGGTYAIVMRATNGVGAAATQPFTLTVDQAPKITSAATATFTAGQHATFTVTASGYPSSLTFSETGTLPHGVTLTAHTGALAGTPGTTAEGKYKITLSATNGVGRVATQSFTLTVVP